MAEVWKRCGCNTNPSPIDEEDMNRYLVDVLEEIKKIKKKGSFTNGNL